MGRGETIDFTSNSPFWDGKSKFYCHCRCGVELPPGWLGDYLRGHYTRTQEWRDTVVPKLTVALTGLTRDSESCQRMSEGRQRFLDSPEGADYRREMSRISTGKVKTSEWCRHLSESVQEAFRTDPTYAVRVSKGNQKPRSRESVQKQIDFYSSPEGFALRERYSEEMTSEKYSGENAYNWKGGHHYRNGYGWKDTRDWVLIRDRRTCQGCGTKEGKLEVHHIDADHDNWDEKDLITTCHVCNMKAERHDEREYWRLYYTSRIESIYTSGWWADPDSGKFTRIFGASRLVEVMSPKDVSQMRVSLIE